MRKHDEEEIKWENIKWQKNASTCRRRKMRRHEETKVGMKRKKMKNVNYGEVWKEKWMEKGGINWKRSQKTKNDKKENTSNQKFSLIIERSGTVPKTFLRGFGELEIRINEILHYWTF